MILRRLIFALAAAATLAAGAGVCVVALAFTLYALVVPYLGASGAAAVVAGASAGLIALAGLVLMAAARPARSRAPPPTPAGVGGRVVGFLREKPVVAVAGALVVGFLAIRNPGYLGAAVRSFMEGREGRPR